MADGEFRRRREQAARAFVARRGGLGMSQGDVARRAGLVPRTVQYFEAGRWPNPATLARLERAVGWPSGEIQRLADPPRPDIDPQLWDRVSELSVTEKRRMILWLEAELADPGPRGDSSARRREG